jgi:hypothetical protein
VVGGGLVSQPASRRLPDAAPPLVSLSFLSDLRWDRITFLLFFSFPRAALSPPSSENVPRSHGTTTTPSWKSREVGLLGF